MKKFMISFFVFALSLAGFSQNYTVNVEGTVLSLEEGTAVSGHVINIMTDSLQNDFYYYNSVVTNDDGYYQDSFEVPEGIESYLTISTNTCNNNFAYEFVDFSENANEVGVDFVVCTNSVDGSCQAQYYYYQADSSSSGNFLQIQFIDFSYGNPETWLWDFGDGTSSTEQNPLHTFASEGSYDVCLTITSSSGECENTLCLPILIVYWENIFEAQFYYYQIDDGGSNENDLTIQFIDFSSGGPDTWLWDFGDGATSTEQNPVHTFEDISNVIVCLNISRSSDNLESSYCEYMYNDDSTDCYGWFEYSVNEMTVDFQGQSMNPGEGTYSWEFGDGTTAEGQSVSHTFPGDGIYSVWMTFSDSASDCFAAYSSTVLVGFLTLDVEGYVFLADSNNNADQAFVYLMTFDTVSNELVNVSTTDISDNGYYRFEEVITPNSVYYVQAELKEISAHYGEYIPTYHYSAMNWEDANSITSENNYLRNVQMIAAESLNLGEGQIDGTVNIDYNRELMSNVEIMLLSEDGLPLTYLRTDENGFFVFNELAFGTYIVYSEMLGMTSQPATVTLTQNNPSATISVVLVDGELVLGIQTISSNIDNVGEVFPNPVSSGAQITIEMKQKSEVQIQVTDIYGKVLKNEKTLLNQGVQTLNLETSQYSQGLYLFRISTNDGINFLRKFVKQ